jgi:hypothetical protein
VVAGRVQTQIQLQVIEEADLEVLRRRATKCVRRFVPNDQVQQVLEILGLTGEEADG